MTPTSGLTWGQRFGYGVGSLCTGTFSVVPGLLLLYYMTNVLAVPAFLAGVVVFAPKVWDLAFSPLVGQWSDRTVSRLGPRRPWLLAGAGLLPVTFALTFIGPPLTGVPAAIFVGVAFLLASSAYVVFEVPFKAMPAEMAGDYHERTTLIQWRMVFVAVALAVSGILAPGIAGQTLDGYRTMGVVFAALMLVAMLVPYFSTARAPMTIDAEAKGTLREQLAAARSSKPYMWLLGLSCAQMLAAGVMLAGSPYFAAYTLNDPGATSTLFAALVGPLLVTMPLWVWLSRRLDKKGAMLLSSAMFLTASLALLATPALGALYAHLCVVIIGLGYAGLQLLQFSMLADVIAHDAAISGSRRGGMFTGLWTAAENAVQSLGALVFGVVIGIGGFISSDPATPITQPGGALTAIVIGTSIVPAVVMVTAIWMTLQYDLTEDGIAAAQQPAETAAPTET
ncbi:MFS transporter [Thermopolyspora sp. NPDC052614]|uniref:MFS transporter n=1 Tax=Thermopolyspora sp. NPDC052614 TaxID=3155682 RepID=UPI00341224EC